MKNRNTLRGKLATFTSGTNSNASTADNANSQAVPPHFISNRQHIPSMSANFMEIGRGLLVVEPPRTKRSMELNVNTNDRGSYIFKKNTMFENMSPTTVTAKSSKPMLGTAQEVARRKNIVRSSSRR